MAEIRLIDANALRNEVYHAVLDVADSPMPNDYASKLAVKMGALIQKKIEDAPTIDAEPIKHGIWEEEPYVWRCSECQKWLMLEQGDADMNFCPHCGARMDGGDKNADK